MVQVTKLSERVLPKLLPALAQCLSSGDADRRRGVCLGYSELMGAAGRESVSHFLSDIIPGVRAGLCDPDESVRDRATHGAPFPVQPPVQSVHR